MWGMIGWVCVGDDRVGLCRGGEGGSVWGMIGWVCVGEGRVGLCRGGEGRVPVVGDNFLIYHCALLIHVYTCIKASMCIHALLTSRC